MTVKDCRRVLLETAVLVAVGSLIGLSLHYQMVIDAFSGDATVSPDHPTSETSWEALPVPVVLQEIDTLLAEGAILLDARDPELFSDGHLPGAVSLPLTTFEEAFTTFQKQVPKSHTLIVYCSGYGCPDSFDLAVKLIHRGFEDVRVFEGGLPQWRDSGRPVIQGRP
ncbi:MAG: hypothetical protein JRE63_10225 [Deltaproteobacteria bacterium]|jgi:rhodanese-related sulfurtransferase|nr:hypothetical protein [Deltaproteobacteria bacterium]